MSPPGAEEVPRQQGHAERAATLHAESLALFREMGNERGTAYALASLGIAALGGGDLDRAQALAEGSLSLYEGLGTRRGWRSR
jgi:hypothetical protein